MEEVSLAVGIVLMLIAAIGIVGYVALVIAIPVCRLIDWLAGVEPQVEGAESLSWQREPVELRRGSSPTSARLARVVASPFVALRTRLHRVPAPNAHGESVCPSCRRPLEALE